jgi:endonuclease-3
LKRSPGGLNISNILKVDEEKLSEILKPVGFYRRKAKSLKSIAVILDSKFGGDIPKTIVELIELPGIGPKMAYLAMQHAWNM